MTDAAPRHLWWAVVASGVLALLVALPGIGVRATYGAHTTADEPHYMGTGAYLWKTGDYHFANTLKFQPPLAHHLASLPLLLVDRSSLDGRDVSRQLVESGAISRSARVVDKLEVTG